MGKQFPNVSGRYGAPMGRASAPDLDTTPRTVRLFQVRLDAGGYDDGGAYWGYGGGAIWCARDREGDIQTVRAYSRAEAAFRLGIPWFALIVPGNCAEWAQRALAAGVLDRDDLQAWIDDSTMEPETKTVFRIYPEGDVIALFPYEANDRRGALYACVCYQHMGQHAGADYDAVIASTRPATEEESKTLCDELEHIGYRVKRIARRVRAKAARGR